MNVYGVERPRLTLGVGSRARVRSLRGSPSARAVLGTARNAREIGQHNARGYRRCWQLRLMYVMIGPVLARSRFWPDRSGEIVLRLLGRALARSIQYTLRL